MKQFTWMAHIFHLSMNAVSNKGVVCPFSDCLMPVTTRELIG